MSESSPNEWDSEDQAVRSKVLRILTDLHLCTEHVTRVRRRLQLTVACGDDETLDAKMGELDLAMARCMTSTDAVRNALIELQEANCSVTDEKV